MSIHTIRIAGPWERHTADAELVRVTLPCQVPGDEPICELIRKFHRPSGLTDASEVHIVFTADTASLQLRLNGRPVPASGSRSSASWTEVTFKVTPLLESFNSLSIRGAEKNAMTLHSAVMQIHENN